MKCSEIYIAEPDACIYKAFRWYMIKKEFRILEKQIFSFASEKQIKRYLGPYIKASLLGVHYQEKLIKMNCENSSENLRRYLARKNKNILLCKDCPAKIYPPYQICGR
jgi:hypothetical protein